MGKSQRRGKDKLFLTFPFFLHHANFSHLNYQVGVLVCLRDVYYKLRSHDGKIFKMVLVCSEISFDLLGSLVGLKCRALFPHREGVES